MKNAIDVASKPNGDVAWTLLFMEVVILHVGFHIMYVHEQIVLLGAISRIGYDCLGITMIA